MTQPVSVRFAPENRGPSSKRARSFRHWLRIARFPLLGFPRTLFLSWEGILYDVGNDFITINQPGRERYIVTDIYALKYIEFYDTRRREQCEAMLKQNGLWNQR